MPSLLSVRQERWQCPLHGGKSEAGETHVPRTEAAPTRAVRSLTPALSATGAQAFPHETFISAQLGRAHVSLVVLWRRKLKFGFVHDIPRSNGW